MNYLDELNVAQKEAVIHTNGPLLIVAGAGAGKTKTLTHRILHIIKQGERPSSILAITFTNKAAQEMKSRVYELLQSEHLADSRDEEKPFVSTFHSLGVHIIKKFGYLLGMKKHFSIFDRSDSIRAVKTALEDTGYDPKQFEPAKILGIISRNKGRFVTLQEFSRNTESEFISNVTTRVWTKYEDTLKREGAVDFDDLLLKTALLLRDFKEVREFYSAQWKYVHIDEYQDTNKVQYIISKLLSEKSRNICVVGDVDQNIYAWRGADIKNIMDFEKDYPEARTILLEENYRSTETILNAANSVIKKNTNRLEKNLFTKKGMGEKIALFEAYDEVDEAHFIASTVKEIGNSGVEWNDISVLYRANFQSRVLEDAFFTHEIPYQILGTKFFERKEIKDLLSYLRLSLNPDSLGDLRRIINSPPRGLGKVSLLAILADKIDKLTPKARATFASFNKTMAEISLLTKTLVPSECLKSVIKVSGMEEYYKQSGTADDEERLENLFELVALTRKYDFMDPEEGISKLLEDAALSSDQDDIKDDKNAVKLMTVHASKGLEFEHVFIGGLEENLFPHRRMGEDASKDKDEEERRLFYVALTRAKKKLHLSLASNRMVFGSRRMNIPSEFLSDFDESLIENSKTKSSEGREKVIFFD